MRDETRPDALAHPAENTQPADKRFKRSIFGGYRRRSVDDAFTRLRLAHRELEDEVVTLREELLEARHEASETRHDLTRARAELRYWNDRASYVDSEVARARQRATELEEEARSRAEAIEADAQERSLQLVDRVCSEANAIMQHAREEAREMFLRFENDVDMSQQKLAKLERVRTDVARSMQSALEQFEEAVRELDKVGPVRRIVESLEEPIRREIPTFGRQKAMDAARRFEDGAEHGASKAHSTPLLDQTETPIADTVTSAGDGHREDAIDVPLGEETQVFTPVAVDDPITMVSLADITAGDGEVEADHDEDSHTQGGTPRKLRLTQRTHEADEHFVNLIVQP
jgi:hypothetical protein